MTESTTTTLIYRGRELDGTKVLYGYTDEEGKRRYWAKPLKRGVAIGGIFEVERVENDGGPFSVREIGQTVGQVNDAGLLAEYSARDKATAVMLAKITNDRKRAREASDPIDDAIEVLRKAMQSQRTIAARAAFASYVESAIHGAR